MLEEFSYASNFINIDGTKLHYLDEGLKTAPVILFLHGVPTWSYTFRNVFPKLVEGGYRTILPDLPGFGLSDKPERKSFYLPGNTVRILRSFIQELGLNNVSLFCHDWGAILGMILLARDTKFFRGVILCNGLLPDDLVRLPWLFYIWKYYSRFYPGIKAGRVVNMGSLRQLCRDEIQAYNHPFRTEKDKVAFRLYPRMIPFKGKNMELSKESWKILMTVDVPVLTIFSTEDPITRGGESVIIDRIPGAGSQEHIMLSAGHFIQEDVPDELASSVLLFLNKIPDETMQN